MRRRADIGPRPFFRNRELPRLMTLTVMLFLIGMLMARARDPKMWAMFSGAADDVQRAGDSDAPPAEHDDPSPAAAQGSTAAAEKPSAEAPADTVSQPAVAPVAEPTKPPALDEDSEELESLKEELQVVADKEFLQEIEMPAYYRMLRWAKSQSAAALQRKAIKDTRFGDIFTRPDDFRGKLVEFRLHVLRVLKHKDLEKDNLAGVRQIWEIFGYNDSSGQNSFICITPELPRDMPVGAKVSEDGWFTGYFLKLMAYEDGQGKMRASPLFIGRFVWEPPLLQKAAPQDQDREVRWGLMVIAAVGLALLVRWGLRQMWAGNSGVATDMALREMRRRRSLAKDSEEETVDINDWLDRSGTDVAKEAINPLDQNESDQERR